MSYVELKKACPVEVTLISASGELINKGGYDYYHYTVETEAQSGALDMDVTIKLHEQLQARFRIGDKVVIYKESFQTNDGRTGFKYVASTPEEYASAPRPAPQRPKQPTQAGRGEERDIIAIQLQACLKTASMRSQGKTDADAHQSAESDYVWLQGMKAKYKNSPAPAEPFTNEQAARTPTQPTPSPATVAAATPPTPQPAPAPTADPALAVPPQPVAPVGEDINVDEIPFN